MMLQGTMYITDDMGLIKSAPLKGSVIVSLDEDGLLDITAPNIISGVCLLPPPEAMIAEADGNEQLYDAIYFSHITSPQISVFISALVASVYKGMNLLFYLPEMGYNNTEYKLINTIFSCYGIHIGLIGHPDPSIANWYSDDRCIPIWLNSIYNMDVISVFEYLYKFPLDAEITPGIMEKIILDLNPYGESYKEMEDYVLWFRKRIHTNPSLKPAIGLIR